MSKKFIEIVATYRQYEVRPYFTIRYEEDGEKFEGLGTYSPEVLSEYIREYFMEEKSNKWELYIQCPACGYKRKWNGEIFNFCPNCGEDLREEKTNDRHNEND